MRLLHLIIDDKFIPGAMDLFDSQQGFTNRYVLVKENVDYQFQYLKNKELPVVNKKELLQSFSEEDAIVLHSLNSIPLELIPFIPSRIKIIWLSWGYDLYNENGPIIPIPLLHKGTKRVFEKTISLKSKLASLYDRFWGHTAREVKKALARIDFYSGVFPYEYDLIKDRYPFFSAQRVDFYYGSLRFFIPPVVEKEIYEKNKTIIVGNSGDPTNNHIDVIDSIAKQSDYNGYSVIMPLSYGGEKEYVDRVIKYGNKVLGPRFSPIINYLPADDYFKIVNEAEIAIFFHERQQASDNVFLQLWNGAVVFMSDSSLMFQYLKSFGFVLFSFQKEFGIVSGIGESDVMRNRELLSRYYSSPSFLERMEELVKVLA